jgi:hypothetical protein
VQHGPQAGQTGYVGAKHEPIRWRGSIGITAGGGMTTDGSIRTASPGNTSREGAAWWPWPLQQWSLPALAPQQLTQPINPDWAVVRVTYNNSSAPDIERGVLEQHSYGRQIGRLMDAVCALAERLPATARADQRIVEFEALAQDILRIKQDARLPRIERLQKDVEALQRDDPTAYGLLKARLSGSSSME